MLKQKLTTGGAAAPEVLLRKPKLQRLVKHRTNFRAIPRDLNQNQTAPSQRNTSMSVLEIYTFPGKRTFYLNTGSTKIYTYPSRRPRDPCGDVVGAWLAMKAWVAVKAWTAETVDGGDKNGSKKVMSGITVKLLLNHCPNYVRNHWRITS